MTEETVAHGGVELLPGVEYEVWSAKFTEARIPCTFRPILSIAYKV